MDPDAIRDELRDGESGSLRRRRGVALFAALGAIDFAVISLYQLGVIRHLPDPPGRIFDSDKVNASRTAYALGVPDGPLGLGLYALTLIFAGAGGSARSGRHPIFDVLLGGAVVAGVGGALHYLYDMVRHQRRACPYCLAGAATHFVMAPLALPGALAASRSLLRRRRAGPRARVGARAPFHAPHSAAS
jgi:uncharacterized membrane protein